MKFDKDTIKRSFSRAAETYDGYCGFQIDAARAVYSLLSTLVAKREHAVLGAASTPLPSVRTSFLDIGCGTGKLLSLYRESNPDTAAYGCDISLTMLRKALENIINNNGLAASDCEALPFIDGSFDIIGSSLTYQWAGDLKTAFSEAARVLKPGGLFVFSTLGPGTLNEIRECYPAFRGLDFKDTGTIEAALKCPGLEVVSIESRAVRKTYSSFLELLKTLKYIGAAPPLACGKGLSPGTALRKAGRLYAERFPSPEGGVIATYELILASARKP